MHCLHICALLSLASVLTESNAAPGQGGGNILLNDVILSSAKDAMKLVDTAYFQSRTNLKTRSKREAATLQDIMAFFKQPVGTTRSVSRSADYLDMTLQLITERLQMTHPGPFNVSDLLTAEQNEMISQLTGCVYQYLPKMCGPSSYRSVNGECNNRKKPILGASNTGFARFLKPEYEDGVSLPRGWTDNLLINGFTLPSARAVSNEIVKFPNDLLTLDKDRSVMMVQFGQFLDHDITLSPDTPVETTFFQRVDCKKTCVKAHPCFPIKIPPNDHRYVDGNECMPLVRSAPTCNLATPVREQINALTSFVDGSQVYGSDNKLATRLRNNTNQLGLLAVNQQFRDNGFPFLPFSGIPDDQCSCINKSLGIPCFLAGDSRVNEQPFLIAFHVLFLREHNRIATELHKLNQSCTGEKLYQETRKIIGGMLQKITYKDWLTQLLGTEMSKVLPRYTSYKEAEDPSISNVFTIAFRFAHTSVPPFIYRLGDGYLPYNPEPVVPLDKTFFATWRVVNQGGIDPLVRGMIANKAKLTSQDQLMVDELRERLFQMVNGIGLDLAALNIQRGRDHGLPGYNAWRRFCGLSAPQNVDELATVLGNRTLAEKLMKLYGTTENIDIWVGGVCEPLIPRGRTGQLFSCLVGEQMRRTRDGDRFYYENPSVFSVEQRRSIEKVTLAHIICANTNITEVPRNVFIGNRYPQDFIKCSNMPALDLKPWKAKVTDDDSVESSSSEDN